MKNLAAAMGTMLFFSGALPAIAQDTSPAHSMFPGIPVYTTAQLSRELNNVVVVDTRPSAAFDEMHIKDAVNIPVRSKKFAAMIQALRKQTTRPIVFYCQGRTSHNPYLATRAAMAVGVNNVFAYDGGVDEWAETYPQHVVFTHKTSTKLPVVQLALQP